MEPKLEILATIERFNNCSLDEDAIAGIARIDFNRALKAISWCLKNQYIYRDKGKFFLTVPGREYLETSRQQKRTSGSFRRWKEEALTGIVERKSKRCNNVITHKSTMDKAVLSTTSNEGLKTDNLETIYCQIDDAVSLKKKLSNKFNLSPEKVDKYFREGRFRVCSGGEPHIGIFDRKNRPTGKGWQHLCRECMKKNRQRANEKRRLERNGPDT